ncbi:MAG: FAD-dependent oxidoreductase [Planctomycetales bacterium]|nr:FAD-dependent oxidoreductase [Planctomycetales bacterium]
MRYDLLVIGDDPAGRWSAVSAAKLSKRVAIIEPPRDLLTEIERSARVKLPEILAEQLALEFARREGEPVSNTGKSRKSSRITAPVPRGRHATLSALHVRLRASADLDQSVFRELSDRYDIATFHGDSRLIDAHSVLVDDELQSHWLEAHRIVIATGTRPRRPERLPSDERSIVDSRTFWERPAVPLGDTIVIGAGTTGASHAALLASLGVAVRLIDGRNDALAERDQTTRDLIDFHRLTGRVVLDTGEEVIGLDQLANGRLHAVLTTGRRVSTQHALLSLERLGMTDHLNLAAANIHPDENGRLWCDRYFRTFVSHIYGLGDVVGFPQTSLSAMDQGLRLVRHAFHTSSTRTAAMRRHLTAVRQAAVVEMPDLVGQGAA